MSDPVNGKPAGQGRYRPAGDAAARLGLEDELAPYLTQALRDPAFRAAYEDAGKRRGIIARLITRPRHRQAGPRGPLPPRNPRGLRRHWASTLILRLARHKRKPRPPAAGKPPA
jgi:hypothetical protein